MIHAFGYYSRPREADLAAFEKHYASVHLPLAQKVPNCELILTARSAESGSGASDIYRIATMGFADQATFDAVTSGPEWRAMASDLGEMVERFGVTVTGATCVED